MNSRAAATRKTQVASGDELADVHTGELATPRDVPHVSRATCQNQTPRRRERVPARSRVEPVDVDGDVDARAGLEELEEVVDAALVDFSARMRTLPAARAAVTSSSRVLPHVAKPDLHDGAHPLRAAAEAGQCRADRRPRSRKSRCASTCSTSSGRSCGRPRTMTGGAEWVAVTTSGVAPQPTISRTAAVPRARSAARSSGAAAERDAAVDEAHSAAGGHERPTEIEVVVPEDRGVPGCGRRTGRRRRSRRPRRGAGAAGCLRARTVGATGRRPCQRRFAEERRARPPERCRGTSHVRAQTIRSI